MLLITELERFSGHPLSNNIDRQFFGIPIQLLFVLVASIVAFGGVAGQVGLFDALDDLISKYWCHNINYDHVNISMNFKKYNNLLLSDMYYQFKILQQPQRPPLP